MTIDEAITYLRVIIAEPGTAAHPKPKEAIQLGLEALKRVKRYKKLKVGFYADLLPGETKE